MSPSHARKRGVKHRYYLSSAVLNGMADRAGSVHRAPAEEIEKLIIKSVREHLNVERPIDDRALVDTHVSRVQLHLDEIIVRLAETQETKANRQQIPEGNALHIPRYKMPSKRRPEILVPRAFTFCSGRTQSLRPPVRSPSAFHPPEAAFWQAAFPAN
jgi:site-specific DNA recombinase